MQIIIWEIICHYFLLRLKSVQWMDRWKEQRDILETKGKYEINTDDFEECVMTFSKSGYLSEKMYIAESDSELQNVIYCSTVELIPKEQDGKGAATGVVKAQQQRKELVILN